MDNQRPAPDTASGVNHASAPEGFRLAGVDAGCSRYREDGLEGEAWRR